MSKWLLPLSFTQPSLVMWYLKRERKWTIDDSVVRSWKSFLHSISLIFGFSRDAIVTEREREREIVITYTLHVPPLTASLNCAW